jgi:hypothetical protein
VGGQTSNAGGTVVDNALKTLEIFDPITNKWSFGTSMEIGRRNMMIGTTSNRV